MTELQGAHQPRFLGRYELMYLLGQGGMGEVHLARLTGVAGFEKLCIVKTILPQMMADPQFVDRFHHEAKVLVQLNHSNIAQVHDMGDVDDTLYMAIEYIAGVDLARVEDRARAMESAIPVPVALLIGQQMCEALGYAHRKVGADGAPLGIVHRDVSPQNVMVSYEGEVKVIDFGLAKSTARSKHTLPSTVLGKLGYMSPEQAKAEKVDHRSDIYSAGIVIWELLAGRPMINGGTVGEMVAMMANPRVPSLRTIRPDEISEAVDKMVMRALAPDPAQRYSRADDFARAINEQLVREGLSVGSEDVGNYVRAMCPEEFAAERQLQSRLSLLRKKGSSPEHQVKQAELEGTMVRSPSGPGAPASNMANRVRTPLPAAPMTAAQKALSGSQKVEVRPSLTDAVPQQRVSPRPGTPPPASQQTDVSPAYQPQPSVELKVEKSKGPLVVVALFAMLVVGGAGALAFAKWSARDNGKLLVDPPPRADPVGREPVAVKPGLTRVATEKVEPDHAEPEKVAEPLKPSEARAIERIDVKNQPVFKVLPDGDRWFAQMPTTGKGRLRDGDAVKLVGEPIKGSTQREVYAMASVVEVKGVNARLLIDGDAAMPSHLFAVEDTHPRDLPRREKQAGSEPQKIGEAGRATEPVRPEPSRPEKTEPARVDPVEVAAKPVEQVKPAVKQLFGDVVRDGTGFNVVNKSDVDWHGCDVRLPNNTVFKYEATEVIRKGSSDHIRSGGFEPDSRAPDVQFKNGWALVKCHEGVGYMKARGM